MSTPNPHDALFKAVFGHPEHARGALRAVVPAAVGDAIDWSTLSRRPGSFVDPELCERHTDLLFSVGVHGGGDTLVYVVFEHQSTPDPLMAYRLLRYAVRIWEGWLEDHKGASALPAIVPVVLYHGGVAWRAARSFAELVDAPASLRAALAPHIPQFRYLLDDLSELSDDELRARAASAAATAAIVALKHGRFDADMSAVLSRWTDVLRAVAAAPNGLDALAVVMRYILMVNDHTPREALQAFLGREVGPEAEETIVTVGQQLIQEGFLQGMEQGIERGIEQGIEQGERAVLLKLMRQRFGDAVDAAIEQKVTGASLTELEIWVGRVLTAASARDVVAD